MSEYVKTHYGFNIPGDFRIVGLFKDYENVNVILDNSVASDEDLDKEEEKYWRATK